MIRSELVLLCPFQDQLVPPARLALSDPEDLLEPPVIKEREARPESEAAPDRLDLLVPRVCKVPPDHRDHEVTQVRLSQLVRYE